MRCRTVLWGLVLSFVFIASQLAGCALNSYVPQSPPQQQIQELLEQGSKEYNAGHFAEALALFREAQLRSAAVANPSLSADIYYRIGRSQLRLDVYAEASQSFERGLQLAKQDNNRLSETIFLHAIGEVLRAQGEPALAREQYEHALTIRQEFGRRLEEARTLAEIGTTYLEEEEFEKAFGYYERARAIIDEHASDSPQALGSILINISSLYTWLGQYERALALQARAVATCEKLPDTACLASAFHNEGFTRFKMSDYTGAIAASKRSLEHQIGQDRLRRAKTLNNLGLSLIEMRQIAEGLDPLNQAVSIFQELNNPKYIAATLDSIGTASRVAGNYSEALEKYYQSLAIWRRINYREGERATLANLGLVYSDQKQPVVAILFLKLAVNISQQLRASGRGLDRELQESLTKRLEPSYRTLASLLVEQGRLAEAREVLELLKLEELHEFLRTAINNPQGEATLTNPELAWQDRYREISDKVALLGRELEKLERTARERGLTQSEQVRRNELVKDLKVASEGFKQFVREMESDVARIYREDSKRFTEISERRLGRLEELQATLSKMGHNVVALHYLVTDDQVRIILTTPKTLLARPSPIASTKLNSLIHVFRTQLAHPKRNDARGILVRPPGELPQVDARMLAEQLYDILLAPVQEDLDQAGARTLMLSLDGQLRYLPFAALYDGQQHLVERYAIAILTDAARDKLREKSSETSWRVAGFGLTREVTVQRPGRLNQSESFSALPNVKDELSAVVRATAAGAPDPKQISLDQEFTETSLQIALDKGYPVVHIASHFAFHAGSERDSYLVLGDAKPLTLAEINSLAFNFQSLELLALSACETAIGGGRDDHGREIEGFGAAAQIKGAQSVLATLWKVADSSTAALMEKFYQQRQRGLTKAEALRQAQLELLGGDAFNSLPPGTAATPGSSYADPFYWAPFILMGNWL